ncbi:TetR/AcrR family transcriptional regulator [Dyella acidiphila]|nr:TetR/AcrR family transcriptional regulator [Dyella acidiphila]
MDVVTTSDAVTHDPELLASDLIALVGEIAVATGPFQVGAACRYLNRVFDEAWQHEKEGELWNRVPRDDCIRYCNPEEPMTLGVVRRLAYQLEIPIADFLRGVDGANQSFGFAATCPLPRSMRAAHRQGVIDAPILVKQMELFLDDGVTPVSLREVARQLGVSVGALRYHAPMLASKLVARSEQYRRTIHTQKDTAVVRAVLDGVRSWSVGSVSPIAKKPLLRMLRNQTGLPKEKLRKAIQRLLRDQVA